MRDDNIKMQSSARKQRDLGFGSGKVPSSQHIYINAGKYALETPRRRSYDGSWYHALSNI